MSSLVIAVTAISMLAVDVSGVWKVRLLTTSGKEAPVIDVVLKQDGEKLTGSCSLQDLDDDFVISGQVKQNEVSSQCVGPALRMSFTGSISGTGREVSGSWKSSANGEGTFTATKR